jgi:hypothetical protein
MCKNFAITVTPRAAALGQDRISASLHGLIAAIPRGQLRVISIGCTADPLTIQLLLQQHCKLESLFFRGTGGWKHVLQLPLADHCLSQIKIVSVEVESKSTDSMQMLLAKCPKLEKITFYSRIYTGVTVLPDWSDHIIGNGKAPGDIGVFSLKHLSFYNVRLPKAMDSLFRRINMTTVHKLSIDECRPVDIIRLFEALTKAFLG